MSVMKTSLTIIPMCPRERFSHYKKLFRLVFCYKKDWATLLHFIYFHCLLSVTIYLITKLSVTYNFSACRENLTKNAYHFLLLLFGFDTLTYRKDYDWSIILVGHHSVTHKPNETIRLMTDSWTVDVHIGPCEYTNDICVKLCLSCDVLFASWYFTKPGVHQYPPESLLCSLYWNPHYRFCSSFSLLCSGIPVMKSLVSVHTMIDVVTLRGP